MTAPYPPPAVSGGLDDTPPWSAVRLRTPDATTRSGRPLLAIIEPRPDKSPPALGELLGDRERVEALLLEHGGLVFRGFATDPSTFRDAVRGSWSAGRHLWMLPLRPSRARLLLSMPLIGALVTGLLGWFEARTTGRRLDHPDASTLALEDNIQFPHHEFGIFFNVPRIVAFFCERASDEGGETLFCDAEAAWEALPERLRRSLGTTRAIRYRNENQLFPPPFYAPALLHHPLTGAPSLNLTGYHHRLVAEEGRRQFPEARIELGDHDENFMFRPTALGADGAPVELSEADYRAIIAAHLREGVMVDWQEGDVMLVDNYRVVHGRVNGGSPRKVLQVILCDYQANATRLLPWGPAS